MPNPGRGTAQNSESQRRGSTSANVGRSQGKTASTTSTRNASRSATTGTSQRQSTAGKQRGTAGTSQSTQTQERTNQVGQAETRQSQPSPGREQTTTSQADRELPVQSSRETTEREGERSTGQAVGPRASQAAPVYGGYGGYGAVPNPFMAIRRMIEDMDRLASNFGFGGSLFTPSVLGQEPFGVMRGLESGGGLPTLWSPQVDVFRRGDQLVVRADLPGIKREDVSVEIDQNALTIRGERRQEFEDESGGIYRSERSYGTFQRSIPLPEGTTADDAQASFTDGVLEITLPSPKNQQKTKKVQIR